MSAPELLARVKSRGATARAEIGDDGAAVLVIAPRALIGDLLPDIQRFKPQLLELLAPTANGFTGSDIGAQRQSDADGSDTSSDARALELLAKYRRGGALLELEAIERAGAAWLALACDLERVAPEKRARAFEQIECNARQLQRALELEAAPVAGNSGATARRERGQSEARAA